MNFNLYCILCGVFLVQVLPIMQNLSCENNYYTFNFLSCMIFYRYSQSYPFLVDSTQYDDVGSPLSTVYQAFNSSS